MKYLLFLFLIISVSSFGQTKDTARYYNANGDTLLTIKTTTTKTASISYPEISVIQVIKPFKTQDTIVTPPPPVTPSKYEGFGSQAIGGSNSSDVRTVRTATEFKNALGSNRTIKFGADVTITGVTITSSFSYCTIDGSGFDVNFNGVDDDGISFDGTNYHHIILAKVRVTNCTGDGINVVNGAHDILIDHCSSYGNKDGNIDVAASSTGKTYNVTVQYCFIGGNNGSGKTLVTGNKVSLHHNIFATGPNDSGGEGAERNPYIHANYSPVGSPNCDFRNNVIYNWGRYASGIGYKATGNFVNNYYASNKGGAINPAADPSGNNASYYVSGNVQLGGSNINLSGGNHSEYIIPDPYKITTTDARTAAKEVLNNVGLKTRTTYEQGIINSITIQ